MKKEELKDYLVQVTIIEARCLKPKDSSGLANPFVKIKCGNLPVQTTDVVKDRLEANWNQSFTFDGLKLSDQGLQTSDLVIEVLSYNTVFRNDLIGQYSIGLSTLYKNPNHEFYNMWMVLFNQEDDPNEAQGYLLIDAFIIGPGDRPPVHDINEKVNQDVSEEDENINIDEMTFEQLRAYQEKKQSYQIIGKPLVARKGFQLACYIFKAESLTSFNKVKPDAFVSARVAGLVRRTKAISNNFSPIFNQKMLFPCYFPFLNDKILLRIWSENGNNKDIFIANIPERQKSNDYFNLSKLISIGGRMPAKWVNLYGIPDEERNKPLKSKIKHPDEGTGFLGRVLLSFSLLSNETPCCATVPTNPFYEQEPDTYVLYCDIYKLKYLKPDQYDIVVWCDCRIGAYSTCNRRKKPSPKKHTVDYEKTPEYNEITLPTIAHIDYPADYEQVPDIFLNLYTSNRAKGEGERIGYIRLSAETVNIWSKNKTPKWLHFKPLDVRKDSPGSVLVNLQFLPMSESPKRIFKLPGITKKHSLFAHIVNGFELYPKNECEDLITKIEVEINDEKAETSEQHSPYPIWNEIIQKDAFLDLELDFAPDVVIRCKRKKSDGLYEEIGKFTVPVESIKRLKKYPHYFNLIQKGEIVGRIMALFYITDSKNKAAVQPKFETIKKTLDIISHADINIFMLGLRNLSIDADYKRESYEIQLTTGKENRTGEIPENVNPTNPDNHSMENHFINIVKSEIFRNIEIRGDENFQIYPYIKLTFTHQILYKKERFLFFNLYDFSKTMTDNKKKLYRVLFEQNLGVTSLGQKQNIIPKDVVNVDEINLNEQEEDQNDEDKKLYEVLEDNYDVMALINKKKKNKIIEDEIEEVSIKVDEFDIDRKLARTIRDYQNMYTFPVFKFDCKPKDKEIEKEIIRQYRKKIYKKIKELKRKGNLSIIETNELMDLEEKFRDAKKPQMNEAIFYSFDDIGDVFSYGRNLLKDDIYENHDKLQIPYKKKELFYLPTLPFVEKFERMDGYYKLGKMTENYLKFNVQVKFTDMKNMNEAMENDKDINVMDKSAPPTKIETNNLLDQSIQQDIIKNDMLENEIEKDVKNYNIFNETYQKKLKYLYYSKEAQKKHKEDNLKLPLNNLRVRVYIYRCLNLAAQDNFIGFIDYMAGYNAFSQANAYLQIQIGDQIDETDNKGSKYIDTKETFVANTLSPDFYQYYEMEADLPRDWKLTINVMSVNTKGTDSLVGSTIIDLEDRYLGEFRTRELLKYKSYESDLKDELDELESKEANRDEERIKHLTDLLPVLTRKIESLKEYAVPVEYRPLMKPGILTAQGVIEMFVEILPKNRVNIFKPAKMERPPPEEYEIRLVIWETRDLVYEEGKKSIDAMITVTYDPEGYLGNTIQKQTDCHLGCKDGKAKFNWRMKFDLVLPCTFPRLTFNVRDFNTFASDESLCSCTISVKRLLKKLLKEGKLELKNKWIQLGNREDPGEPKGEIKIDIYFIQKFEAEQNPVGEAQDEPNHSPKLTKPTEGRGILDFIKGTFLDFTAWKFNFSLFGTLKVLAIIAIIVILIVILFITPGILVK